MHAQVQEQVTEWINCKDGPWHTFLPNGGIAAYRIHQRFDGLRWFQRHEWKNVDGTTTADEWINGASGWCSPRAVAA